MQHGKSTAGSGAGHGTMPMKARATGPQTIAVTVLSLVALVAGVVVAGIGGDLTMRRGSMGANGTTSMSGMQEPTRIGNLVMPPGMVMTKDMDLKAMADMAAVDPSTVSYTAPPDARGGQRLPFHLDGGTKVYRLDAAVIRWNILPHTQVTAYAFNHQVPGPQIRITEGDRVRFIVTNHLPEPTTVHWHGLILPNGMDGPADITQHPIPRGGSFTYEFTVKQAGTFFYHSHTAADRQQGLGLAGALIIDPKDPNARPKTDHEVILPLQEWTMRSGYTFPSMEMEGLLPNFFTIDGKAYPSTQTVQMKVGQSLLVRFIGAGSFIHPMHIHGGPFRLVATDGNPVPTAAQLEKDTVLVGPGERYDVIWQAREHGKWLLHCHINHHVTNDGTETAGGGGLTMLIDVSS